MVIISLFLLSKIKSNPIYSISQWLNWTIDSWFLSHSNNFWVGVDIKYCNYEVRIRRSLSFAKLQENLNILKFKGKLVVFQYIC